MCSAARVRKASELLLSAAGPLFITFAETRRTAVKGRSSFWMFQSAQEKIYSAALLLPVVNVRKCEDCRITTGSIYNDNENANDSSNEKYLLETKLNM